MSSGREVNCDSEAQKLLTTCLQTRETLPIYRFDAAVNRLRNCTTDKRIVI
jgi:hypothetical protein